MNIEKLWLQYFISCKIRIADMDSLRYSANHKNAFYNGIEALYLELIELHKNENKDCFNKFMEEILNGLTA